MYLFGMSFCTHGPGTFSSTSPNPSLSGGFTGMNCHWIIVTNTWVGSSKS